MYAALRFPKIKAFHLDIAKSQWHWGKSAPSKLISNRRKEG